MAALLSTAACTATSGGSTTPPAEETTPPPATTAPADPAAEEETRERKDLVSFTIDDRSDFGIKNIWITWTITNNSSEKSNYRWDWEAVTPDGTRMANSTQFVTDVLPGQTTKGDFPTTLDTADVKLNVTDFDRTKSP
ncbi:hypothetical protein BJP40_06820 [Streptomyces sp. CC53]|nr:hypothetical protein BJP40_06820 [Streptomyces sp. CC53]